MSNKKTLQILVIGLSILALVALISIAIFAVLLWAPPWEPTPVPLLTTDVPPSTGFTPSPGSAFTSISGRVWHDLCAGEDKAGSIPLTPPAGCMLSSDGSYHANGILESGEAGLGGVLIQLGAGDCPAADLATAISSLDGSYIFSNLSAGVYCVSIDTARTENAPMLPGGWTFPAVEAGSSVASHTVVVSEDKAQTEVNFGWDYKTQPGPAAVPTQTPQPSLSQTPQPLPSAVCTNRAAFVQDVTIPDYTTLSPGQFFVKTWRLRNSGTCAWGQGYALVFAGGDGLGGLTTTPLSGTVKPGETLDLSLTLIAPTGNGTYQGKWQLRTPDGVLFGVGKNAKDPFWVRIVVGSTPTASPPPPVGDGWRGEYYGNRELSGTPAVVQNDAEINFNWGNGAPVAALPADGFSARWSRTISFQAGDYRFSIFSDDGARVWLDEELIIDQWRDATDIIQTRIRALSAAPHTLRVEYYDNIGTASMRFWWEQVASYPEWRGEYWANATLSGNPMLMRNDAAIDFYWSKNAPATNLPADNFSARWSRQTTFEPGRYRFIARVDDGVRFMVDGKLVLDEWRANDGKKDYMVDLSLSGSHQLVVEYYEGAWDAWIKFWWERIGD